MEYLKGTDDFVPFVGFLLGFPSSVLPFVAVALLLSSSDWHKQIRPQCRHRVCSEKPLTDFLLSDVLERWESPLQGALLMCFWPLQRPAALRAILLAGVPWWMFQASNLFIFLTVCWKQWVRLSKTFNKQKLEEGEPLNSFTGCRPIPRVTSLPLFYLLRNISTGFEPSI